MTNHAAHGMGGEISSLIQSAPGRLPRNPLHTSSDTNDVITIQSHQKMLTNLGIINPDIIMNKDKDFILDSQAKHGRLGLKAGLNKSVENIR